MYTEMIKFNKEHYKESLLSKNELYFLRLSLFGYSKEQMLDFFNADYGYLEYLRKNIESVFFTEKWNVIIQMSMRLNCFDLVDYSNAMLKSKALDFINHDITIYLENDITKATLRSKIKEETKKLYRRLNVEYRLRYFYYASEKKLTEVDIKIIQLKYQGYTNKRIIKNIGCSNEEFEKMVEGLFEKIQAYNWFAVFRLTSKYGILNTETKKIETHINQTANLITNVLKSDLSVEDKKTRIYRAVIKMITFFEFKMALRSKAFNIINCA
jgi:DNA-binding CsgD family transcriptional regulator